MKRTPYTYEHEKLRQWLRQKREERGLSIRAAADLVGRHHSIIGKIEQERKRIDVAEFVEYCLALQADPHEGLQVLMDAVKRSK